MDIQTAYTYTIPGITLFQFGILLIPFYDGVFPSYSLRAQFSFNDCTLLIFWGPGFVC